MDVDSDSSVRRSGRQPKPSQKQRELCEYFPASKMGGKAPTSSKCSKASSSLDKPARSKVATVEEARAPATAVKLTASKPPRPVRACTTTSEQTATTKPKKQPAAAPPKCSNQPFKAARVGATKAAAGRRPRGPQSLTEFDFNGVTYRLGDSVYLLKTEDTSAWPEDVDPEELCEICSRGHSSRRGELLECGGCLAAFHTLCLTPKLTAVPDGDWLCDDCDKGRTPQRPLRTAAAKYLFGGVDDSAVLALVRITEIVRNRLGDGRTEMEARYYHLPEETVRGRDKSKHHTREVFLTWEKHWEDTSSVFRHAAVVPRAEVDATPGMDVFVCDYAYDTHWKVFKLLGEASAEEAAAGPGSRRTARGDDDDEEGSGSDGGGGGEEYQPHRSKHEDDDDGWVRKKKAFNPITSLWRAKGLIGRGGGRGGGGVSAKNAGANRYGSGIQSESGPNPLGHLGSSAVPSHAPQCPLAAARTALSLAAVPTVLPCRDLEKAHLTQFVDKAVNCDVSASPGVLYICGVPGTGKTACVMEVLKAHRVEMQQKGVQMVEINALQLPSPLHVYSKLWEKLVGQRLGPARALAALQAMFGPSGPGQPSRRLTTIILIDEIDMLMTRDQAVLYNLFDWPMSPGSRLSVIGISNTHDLDERVLPRIASRLANQKLAFQPYNKVQLMAIIKQRLHGGAGDVFKDSALEFAAMKAASTTGDVRRALELLRRAADLAHIAVEAATARGGPPPASYKQLVTETHVMEAQREQFNSAHMEMLRGCCLLEKLMLAGQLVAMRAGGKPDVTLLEVHHRLSSTFGPALPEARCCGAALMAAAGALVAKRLVRSDAGWKHLQAKVTLQIPKDDLLTALKEDERLMPLASLLH